MNHIEWPLAIAFIGMCFAIAYAAVNHTPQKTAQVVCIEQRGKWVSDWQTGTCEFADTATKREPKP